MMKPTEKTVPSKKATTIELSRSEEVRQVVGEYVNDLREIIKKLDRRLLN